VYVHLFLRGKNNLAEIFTNLATDTDLKIILSNYQNNYVKRSSVTSKVAKNFDILATSLSVIHNYFDDPINFSSYLAF